MTRKLRLAALTLLVTAGALGLAGNAAGARGSPVELVLALKVNGAGLARFATAVSTPGSPLYGHYEPIPWIARRFGASPSARGRVVSWLRAHGGRDVRVDATGALAEAVMSASTARTLFGPAGASAARSGGMRAVPEDLRGAVSGVFGIDAQSLSGAPGVMMATARERSSMALGSAQPSSEQPRTGTPHGCRAGQQAGEVGGDPSTAAFTPAQYLSAYDFGPLYGGNVLGQGQRLALIETDGVKPSDMRAFADCFGGAGFRIPPIHQYRVDIKHLPAPGEEATADAEIAAITAPGLDGIDLYETKPDISHVLVALTAPLQHAHRLPHVISVSLGTCDPAAKAALGKPGLATSQFALNAATAGGVTIVAASGDTGSAGCQRIGRPPQRKLAVLFPASSWFVTAVGGTNLDLTSDNQIADEFVWNDAGLHLGAGGGGLSAIWTRPPIQKGFVRQNARAVPDVSMLADVRPGYAIYCTTGDCRRASRRPWVAVGGTSAATPLFAAGLTLINQLLRSQDKEYLGFLDPLLYSLAKSSFGPSVLHDVTRIGNDVGLFLPGGGGPLGCCTAHAGYDEASGLGSVAMANLAQFAVAVAPHSLGEIVARVPSHQRPLARNVLRLKISCSQACYALGEVIIQPKGKGEHSFKIYSSGFHLARRGTKAVQLHFTAAQLRHLRSVRAHHHRIIAIAYGVLTNKSFQFQKYSAPVPFTIKG